MRYADDFVSGFQFQLGAVRFQSELRKRMGKFGLEPLEDKTRLIEFGRFVAENRKSR